MKMFKYSDGERKIKGEGSKESEYRDNRHISLGSVEQSKQTVDERDLKPMKLDPAVLEYEHRMAKNDEWIKKLSITTKTSYRFQYA